MTVVVAVFVDVTVTVETGNIVAVPRVRVIWSTSVMVSVMVSTFGTN